MQRQSKLLNQPTVAHLGQDGQSAHSHPNSTVEETHLPTQLNLIRIQQLTRRIQQLTRRKIQVRLVSPSTVYASTTFKKVYFIVISDCDYATQWQLKSAAKQLASLWL